MPGFSSFENHVFVSYAHIDNYHFSGTSSGWIDLLHERLEIRLAQLLGKPPKIWRDRKLAGNDVFNDTIVIELAKTAILLCVISPRYMQSESCRRELEGFFRLSGRTSGVRIGDRHRVFKVAKSYVALQDHPRELQELLGYEFYEHDQASGRVREFDHEISSKGEKDKRYWDKFEDLVWDIRELIGRLEGSYSRDAATAAASGASVYLAETTSDLTEERDRIKRELQQYGRTLLPDKPLPLNGPALRDAVREYLGRSNLSVHLIGQYYGVVPEMEAERSVVRLQEELAVERGDDAGFSRLVWMPPGLQPADERQQKFIADLQNSFSSGNGSELLQVKLEDLKTIIQDKLTRKEKAASVPGEGAGSGYIYVISDRQDMKAIQPLRDYLFDQGFEAVLPLSEGSEAEVLEDHKQNLLACDGVLIFQSQAGEGWLRMKLRELIKLPGYGRITPLLGKAIYISAPQSQQKDLFRTNEALVIRNYGDFSPASLLPFVTQISKAKGASR